MQPTKCAGALATRSSQSHSSRLGSGMGADRALRDWFDGRVYAAAMPALDGSRLIPMPFNEVKELGRPKTVPFEPRSKPTLANSGPTTEWEWELPFECTTECLRTIAEGQQEIRWRKTRKIVCDGLDSDGGCWNRGLGQQIRRTTFGDRSREYGRRIRTGIRIRRRIPIGNHWELPAVYLADGTIIPNFTPPFPTLRLGPCFLRRCLIRFFGRVLRHGRRSHLTVDIRGNAVDGSVIFDSFQPSDGGKRP